MVAVHSVPVDKWLARLERCCPCWARQTWAQPEWGKAQRPTAYTVMPAHSCHSRRSGSEWHAGTSMARAVDFQGTRQWEFYLWFEYYSTTCESYCTVRTSNIVVHHTSTVGTVLLAFLLVNRVPGSITMNSMVYVSRLGCTVLPVLLLMVYHYCIDRTQVEVRLMVICVQLYALLDLVPLYSTCSTSCWYSCRLYGTCTVHHHDSRIPAVLVLRVLGS